MPILLLTARDAVEDRVRGLETGADDYLVKPFAFAELLAAAFILPSFAAMLAIAVGYSAATALPGLGAAIQGLTAAVGGLLLVTLYRLGKTTIREPVTAIVALAAFLAGAVGGLNAAFIVIAAGLLGVVLLAPPRGGAEGGG